MSTHELVEMGYSDNTFTVRDTRRYELAIKFLNKAIAETSLISKASAFMRFRSAFGASLHSASPEFIYEFDMICDAYMIDRNYALKQLLGLVTD